MIDFKDKVVLVTGGAGFIGHHLVELLLESDPLMVYVVDDFSTGQVSNIEANFSKSNFHLIEKCVTKITSEDFQHKIDFIFHLAALVSVPASFKEPQKNHFVNESGFISVLEIAKNHKVSKVVYASSSAVYGDQKNMPISETVELNPLSPYGLSKRLNETYAENYFKWYNIPSIGCRFFNVYGPGQKDDSPYSGVISLFIKKMKEKSPITIYGTGNQERDFIFVKDVVKFLGTLALSNNTNLVVNIGTGTGTSVNELFELVKDHFDYILEPEYVSQREGDIFKSIACVKRLNKLVRGIDPVPLSEGIKSTLGNFLTS